MVLIPASRLQLCHLESSFHTSILSPRPLLPHSFLYSSLSARQLEHGTMRHTVSPGKWAGTINPLLLFAKNISVVSLSSTYPLVTYCCTRYPPLQDQQVLHEQEESLHYFTMPLNQIERRCCHLKCFWFHQEISLFMLSFICRVVSIKIEPLAMISMESRV